jgi:hypothetical protein
VNDVVDVSGIIENPTVVGNLEVDPGFGDRGVVGAGAVPSCWTERMMKKARRKIDATLKVKIAREA